MHGLAFESRSAIRAITTNQRTPQRRQFRFAHLVRRAVRVGAAVTLVAGFPVVSGAFFDFARDATRLFSAAILRAR